MSVFETIDSKILEEIVQHLKSSTCYLDTLPTSFFKSVLNCLEADLLEVVNTSLLSETFPNSLKTAVVKPLLKKRNLDNTMLSNYRPISNLPSLPALGKSDHATIFLTPEYKQRIIQESPGVREVTCWSSHSEAMLQASLDDVDWDMFRASSADVSEFTDVALSFVYMLTDQATEMVTIRTFSNQKPWLDRTIRAAVNQRTAAYNAGLLSGNMSEYKASCYALRRAVRAAKLRYRERIESHFQLNDSRRMWQGLKTICSSGNNPSAEVRADPLLAEELNTFYGRFECNGSATLPISASGSSRQSSDDDHVITVSVDWIQDFLTGRPQVVKMGQFTSNSITLNVGAPQGCVLSPLLYSLYTHDCMSSHSSTSIDKFADDTVVLGLISNNDETAYLGEVERLTSWCQDNCLSLNVSKTKELIVDFREGQQRPYTPLMISGTPVERVSSLIRLNSCTALV